MHGETVKNEYLFFKKIPATHFVNSFV